MSPCHPFRPVPGQCGPNRRGPLPAPPFDPQDYWATRKLVSSLFGSLETTKLDKVDVVDPVTATEDGKAADARKTQDELNRVCRVASDAKAIAESKADLVGGKVPEAQLPSYVDDVLEYGAVSAFPAVGERGKIYVATDTDKTYRWGGTQYVEIARSPALDDTVTAASPNGVKSSGIWSWVKSLLPKWLTSDYAEPATVASVEVKADKATTLSGYGITDAVPFVADYSGNKTAVTIGNRASNIPVGGHSLANGKNVTALGDYSHAEGDDTSAHGMYSHAEGAATTASGDYSHAEGVNTTASGDFSHAEGGHTTASGDYSHAEGSYTTASGVFSHAGGVLSLANDEYSYTWNGDYHVGDNPYPSHGPGTFNINPEGGLDGFWIGEQTLYAILTNKADKADISATDPTFSNAVLAVGLNIDTNSVAVLNEIADTFGGFPIEGTATTVGGLLAALAAAAAWLKKNKVQTLKLNDNSVETSAENGVAKLDDFFTGSNGLLTATIDEEVISKGTAPDAHLEVPTDTDDRLKLILADNSVAYDSAKALPYKLTSVIGDRVVATMTLTAASTDITLPTITANDTTVKDFILDVTNAYAVEGVATDAGINIPRTDFKLVTRDGESLTAVTTVKAGKSAFICFTQKSPVVVDGTTYPCWCVIQLPFGDPS